MTADYGEEAGGGAEQSKADKNCECIREQPELEENAKKEQQRQCNDKELVQTSVETMLTVFLKEKVGLGKRN